MKLQTSIRPNALGVVQVTGEDRQHYDFTPDADGVLVCEVAHEPTIARLLSLGDFEPVDPADYDVALDLTKQGVDVGDTGDVDNVEGDDLVDPNALPIEAHTPPVPAREATPKPAAKKIAK